MSKKQDKGNFAGGKYKWEKSRKETAEKIKEAKLLAPSKGSTRSSKMTSLGAASKKDADIDDAMVCIPLLAVLELPILTNEYLA